MVNHKVKFCKYMGKKYIKTNTLYLDIHVNGLVCRSLCEMTPKIYPV